MYSMQYWLHRHAGEYAFFIHIITMIMVRLLAKWCFTYWMEMDVVLVELSVSICADICKITMPITTTERAMAKRRNKQFNQICANPKPTDSQCEPIERHKTDPSEWQFEVHFCYIPFHLNRFRSIIFVFLLYFFQLASFFFSFFIVHFDLCRFVVLRAFPLAATRQKHTDSASTIFFVVGDYNRRVKPYLSLPNEN